MNLGLAEENIANNKQPSHGKIAVCSVAAAVFTGFATVYVLSRIWSGSIIAQIGARNYSGYRIKIRDVETWLHYYLQW